MSTGVAQNVAALEQTRQPRLGEGPPNTIEERDMISIRFGRWSREAGFFFVHQRIYAKILGGRSYWTPFCRARKRYNSWFGFWASPSQD